MTKVELPYLHRYRDRHGKVRVYVRRPGHKRVALRAKPGSAAFLAEYRAAVEAAAPMPKASEGSVAPGSIDALAVSYYQSSGWRKLSPTTQAPYRRLVERIRSEHGHRLVSEMTAQHVTAIIEKRADRPTSANHLLRMLRLLMRHAVKLGMRNTNPTMGVDRIEHRSDGIATWSEDDIAAYETTWPSGSRERLALALLLYTGQRRGDVVKMGRQHLRQGGLSVRQQKTGAELLLPIHPALAAEIDRLPAGQLTFLVTHERGGRGQPFTAAGFYNAFAGWCRAAGLPVGRSPHGLRKACARRLAEAGCTAHQIAAITGHVTLAEVQRYTKAADQKLLAAAAMMRFRDAS